MGVTLADIKAQEEKLKKEQAKLRQQKKRLIEKENAESILGLNLLLILSGGYRRFLTISNTKNQWIMSGLLMKNQRQANEII